MAPLESPSPNKNYQLVSKATGFALGVRWEEGDSWDLPDGRLVVPSRTGDIWAIKAADIGYLIFLRCAPNQVLDSNAARQAYILTRNKGNYQKWRIFSDGEGYWQLVNVATGLALDGTDQYIYTLEPNDGAYQRWLFAETSRVSGQP